MRSQTKQVSQWQRSVLYVNANDWFERLLDRIGSARDSIVFEYYIFEADSLGMRFVAALVAAARRGVRVRVMMDGVGSADSSDLLSEHLHGHGVEVRIYHPLPWLANSFRWSRHRGGWAYLGLLSILNINRRNHRKLCVIDAETAWIGSFNISAKHLPKDAGGEGWRDYGVELNGERVSSLVQGFNSLWSGHKPRLSRGFLASYLSNRSLRARRLKNRFVARSVANAVQRVWLVNAYFLPTAAMGRALRQASRNGTQVCLMLPEYSDVAIFPGLSSLFYRALMRAGARIFLYQPGVLHAKALLVDNFAVLGSSNWNYRSTLHDLELDAVIRSPETLLTLEQAMLDDAANCRELTVEDTPVPSLLSRLLYAVRYWM